MTFDEIKQQRQTNNYDGDTHESIFRSYHILNKVIEMIDRGDSKETIFEVIDFLHGSPRTPQVNTNK